MTHYTNLKFFVYNELKNFINFCGRWVKLFLETAVFLKSFAKRMMMIEGVIFDADGTLLDSMEIWMKVTPLYLSKKGKRICNKLQKLIYSMSLEEGCAFIKKEFCLAESPEEIALEILSIIKDFYCNEVLLKPGVFEFLQILKEHNIPVCVASAGNRELMELAFLRLGILSCFKQILTCSEMKVNKSVPDIYDKATQILGTKPKSTIVFEDSLLAIKTAKKAGYLVAGVSDIFNQDDIEKIKETCNIFVDDFRSDEFLENWRILL